MTLRREEWERVAANYDAMGMPKYAERIRAALTTTKRVNVSINIKPDTATPGIPGHHGKDIDPPWQKGFVRDSR